MSKFSLINQLDENAKNQASKDPNAPNIKYQEYDIDIGNDSVKILIPIRECDNFENTIMEEGNLSNYKFKRILREHRGLLVRD